MSEWLNRSEPFDYVNIVPPNSEQGPKFPSRPDLLFDRLQARDYIDQIRVEAGGSLDMFATAERLGFPLYISKKTVNGNMSIVADGQTTGMGLERGECPIAMYIRPDTSEDRHRLIFGHEAGHIFLEEITKVYIHGAYNRDVERFCEYFGRQMAVDLRSLSEFGQIDRTDILELLDTFRVDPTTLFMQLMAAGKLPRKVSIDTVRETVPNSFYSQKIERNVVCLDCELGIEHQSYQLDDETTAFDFTDRHWDLDYSDCTPLGVAQHVAINKAYGRWSELDEALIPEELEREAELRSFLAKRAFKLDEDSWDEPF